MRSYSALIEAFEDTQLVIDVYNDAKNNVRLAVLCSAIAAGKRSLRVAALSARHTLAAVSAVPQSDRLREAEAGGVQDHRSAGAFFCFGWVSGV